MAEQPPSLDLKAKKIWVLVLFHTKQKQSLVIHQTDQNILSKVFDHIAQCFEGLRPILCQAAILVRNPCHRLSLIL